MPNENENEAWSPHDWDAGEIITRSRMNTIENQLNAVTNEITNAHTYGEGAADSLGERIDNIYDNVEALRNEVTELQSGLGFDLDSALFSRTVSLAFSKQGYIKANGEYLYTTNAQNTGYIPVTGFETIIVTAQISAAGLVIAFYDIDFNIMLSQSIIGHETDIYITTIPENAKYVIISNYGNNNKSAILYPSQANLKKAQNAILHNIARDQNRKIEFPYLGYIKNDGTYKYTTATQNTGLIAI